LAQVLVTSRIIGYNPERLQQADFKQFTIQPLDKDETHEFIDRWYDLALGADADKARLVTRLKDAIANSKAIQNLADNPLLLTMMAILNRRQELPRDRADLYDQASRVLLYHWDVDHKRLQLPMDTIGRREKQEMLRLIAYAMQTSEEGLKGNLIRADRLVRILTDYLRDQGFEGPREKANGLIEQLRHRNWILCDRGADTYGFVHRTFLEYFCAMEIVHRFEKARMLTFEQLRDEVFGAHWQDETWHEVLKLICGSIDSQATENLIVYLIDLPSTTLIDLPSTITVKPERIVFSESVIFNILLAAECFLEIRNHNKLIQTSERILENVKIVVEDRLFMRWHWEAIDRFSNLFAKVWGENDIVLTWLLTCLETRKGITSQFAMVAIIQGWSNNLDILALLKVQARGTEHLSANRAAVQELTKNWKDDPDTLIILKQISRKERESSAGRQLALQELAKNWKDEPDTLSIIEAVTQNSKERSSTRSVAIEELAKGWKNKPETFANLKNLARFDKYPQVRYGAVKNLIEFWQDNPEVLELLCWIVVNDLFSLDDPSAEFSWYRNPRRVALESLIFYYPAHPKTLELLHDRALNDPDDQLRTWAQAQLKLLEANP
jgi:hypothetical protein